MAAKFLDPLHRCAFSRLIFRAIVLSSALALAKRTVMIDESMVSVETPAE
jgi:hypothetical protein